MNPKSQPSLQLLRLMGDSSLAEVAVSQARHDARFKVETVDGLAPPLTREQKWIINVSTQFGCPVGCPFCDAGDHYEGNLSTEEILAQVQWALDRHPQKAPCCKKLKVHFARMGEPSLNDSVLEAMERLPQLINSPGLWCCVATVAPAGRTLWFEKLLDLKEQHFRGRFQLQFSVQSTSEPERQRLIPIPHWSLREINTFGLAFFQPGDRKVVLNFALAQGVDFLPMVLSRHFDPAAFAVKITPVNPTRRGQEHKLASLLDTKLEWTLHNACCQLEDQGFEIIKSKGSDRENEIGSNCGQAVAALNEHPSTFQQHRQTT